MTMTEEQYLNENGFNDHDSWAALIVSVATIAGAMYFMKRQSDAAREKRGEKKESWKEWLLR